MNLLDLIPGQYKKAGNKNGGEYAGSCPWCGDGGKGKSSDRFHIWPEQGRNGTYWCRMCGKAGDAIKYLVDHDGLEFKAALDRLGLHPDALGPRAAKVPAGWKPTAAARPAEVWAEHALKFVNWCHDRLLERPDELAWLSVRGIGIDMVKKYRLGWNPTHAWRERPAWGLAPEKKPNGKLKKLWLPRGLVIPLLSEAGQVLRLRIRQPDQSPRYMVIPGSSREPLCSRAAEAMVIVESELDAILLDGLAGDLAGVVAMGNDTAKPTAALLPILQEAMFIAVALDSDLPRYNPDTGSMDMPGAKASRWWLEQFSQAVRVPVIGGKDPGDAYKEGIDLRSWVLAALPPYFQVKADLDAEKKRRLEELRASKEREKQEKKDDEYLQKSAENDQKTDISCQKNTGNDQKIAEIDQDSATVRTVTLKNGRTFCITSDREEWDKLAAAGEIVFSDNELQRLQQACQTMNADEKQDAAALILDVKEIFGPAWICRGEAINKG